MQLASGTTIRHEPRTPAVTPVQVTKGDKGDPGAPGGSDASFAAFVTDPASLTRAGLSATYESLATFNAKAHGGAIGDGVADDTAAIQALLDNALVRRVYLPSGAYRLTGSLNVPAGKHVDGDYSRVYDTVPTSGARLVCTSAAQTAPLVTTNGRCKITNIAIVGAGVGAQHDGVRILSNGVVIRDAAILNCSRGVHANYHMGYLNNVSIYANASHGVQNMVDGSIIGCTINVNGGNGVDQQGGANSTHIVHNRIEWNKGHGVSVFNSAALTITNNYIDRSSKNGLALISSGRCAVVGNLFWRNGAQSSGVSTDDCHLRLEGATECTVTGNQTMTGADDDGGGYASPAVAVRTQSNVDCVIVGNDLKGATATSVSTIVASTGSVRLGNKLRDGESEPFVGQGYIALGTGNVASGASGNVPAAGIPGTVLGTFAVGVVYDVTLTSRDGSTGTDNVATCKLFAQREGGAATVAVLGLTNVQGTAFATSAGAFNVSATVTSDSGTITLTIQNTTANTVNFRVLVR